MTNENSSGKGNSPIEPFNKGYSPISNNGYRPSTNVPTGDSSPQGGYSPTSHGNNPTNPATNPPGDD